LEGEGPAVTRNTPVLNLDIPTRGALALRDNKSHKMPRLGDVSRCVLQSGGWDNVGRILRSKLGDRDGRIVIDKLREYVALIQAEQNPATNVETKFAAERAMEVTAQVA